VGPIDAVLLSHDHTATTWTPPAAPSSLVVGLALVWPAGRGAARILEAGRNRIGLAIGLGLLLFFGLPILAVIALVTILGIPFGVGLLAALLPIHALGYGAAASILGRSIVREPTSRAVDPERLRRLDLVLLDD
jgi:hypothetical protein